MYTSMFTGTSGSLVGTRPDHPIYINTTGRYIESAELLYILYTIGIVVVIVGYSRNITRAPQYETLVSSM